MDQRPTDSLVAASQLYKVYKEKSLIVWRQPSMTAVFLQLISPASLQGRMPHALHWSPLPDQRLLMQWGNVSTTHWCQHHCRSSDFVRDIMQLGEGPGEGEMGNKYPHTFPTTILAWRIFTIRAQEENQTSPWWQLKLPQGDLALWRPPQICALTRCKCLLSLNKL